MSPLHKLHKILLNLSKDIKNKISFGKPSGRQHSTAGFKLDFNHIFSFQKPTSGGGVL